MKVFVITGVLCEYTCGCIIVAAKNRKEAAAIIKEKRNGRLHADYADITWENLEEKLVEITTGYYEEIWGGG